LRARGNHEDAAQRYSRIVKLFRRRHARPPAAAATSGDPRPAIDDGLTAVVVVVEDEADEARAAAQRAEAWRKLRRIAAEAVIRQDEAEDLLADVREREPLAELAPRGGQLVSRFVALRAELPECDDPALRRHVSVLEKVFDHHALMLSSSLDLLAVDWRSERMVEELQKIDGLGAPAQWLEAVRAELREPDEALD
jgi:hypothetical protein